MYMGETLGMYAAHASVWSMKYSLQVDAVLLVPDSSYFFSAISYWLQVTLSPFANQDTIAGAVSDYLTTYYLLSLTPTEGSTQC